MSKEIALQLDIITKLLGDGGSEGNNNTDVVVKLEEIRLLLDPTHETQATLSGSGSIPAGLKTVLINNLSGTSTISINGNTFQLGGGRRITVLTLSGSNLNMKNGILPAIVITGGTWQWIALNTLTI